MKFKKIHIFIFIAMVFFSRRAYAQEHSKSFGPAYITITTLHGVKGVDLKEWKQIEQAYFEKVTSKINILISSEVLISNIKNDFSDIKVIHAFRSWDDIQRFEDIKDELIKKAWPDVALRKDFFEKQNSFYSNFYSNEIFVATKQGYKMSDKEGNNQNKSFTFLVQTSTLSDNSSQKSYDIYKKYVNEIIRKNSFIKAYYPIRHLWGHDSRDFKEIFVLESPEDVKKVMVRNNELLKNLIPNGKKRADFIKVFNEGLLRKSNAIYINIPSLTK